MLPAATDPATVQTRRIALLHQYNTAKDVAQRLLGILAERRGVPLAELYAARSLPLDS